LKEPDAPVPLACLMAPFFRPFLKATCIKKK
jgi:hypothetical protein